MFTKPSDSPEQIADYLAHEIGHAMDFTHLTNAERDRWRQARGISAPWHQINGYGDFESGGGDFAEAFKVAVHGGTSRSRVAGQPTPAQLTLLEQLLS